MNPPTEWAEVFDKRSSGGSDTDSNPWNSAPMSDVEGGGGWANFASDPFALKVRGKIC